MADRVPGRGRIRRLAPAAAAGVALTACAGYGPPPAVPGLAVVIDGPVTIPDGRAHATFQGGGQVQGADRYEPWCELEVRAVAQDPVPAPTGRYPVRGVREGLIRDYHTRAPALIGGAMGCSDLVFQETVWGLAGGSADPVLWLRCLAPYSPCRLGPPLGPDGIAGVVGPALRIETPAGG